MFEFGANRKDEHLELAKKQYTQESASDFLDTHFVHQALPEMKVEDVDMSTSIAGLDLPVPFFINAMTGGSENAKKINRLLGILSYYTKVPLASGSVSAAIKDPSVADSFSIMRKENPHGIIFANLGAHHDIENAKRAVDLLEANALQIHVNAPQELVMFEGDRDFSMWLTNIERLVQELEVPVIVKEVGFGMSRETIAQLASVGVKTVDISGTGGTDFIKIENARRGIDQYHFLNGWGQSTVTSLVEAMSLKEDIRPSIIASGGVKNAMDVAKCLSLGADLVGLSNRFLQLVVNDIPVEDILCDVERFKDHIAVIMTLLGAKTIKELRQKDLVLAPNVVHWCEARGIDWKVYARRSVAAR